VLIKNAELDARTVVDLRCERGQVCEINDVLEPRSGERLIDAAGGALLPGLHDHHIHLHAFAAAHSSVICGPPRVSGIEQLRAVLEDAEGGDWIRGIAYHDSVAGELDRWQLDELVSNRPVRIQHRSGKLWVVNSAAARILDLEQNKRLDGVECDADGRPNGRLFRLDDWMRSKLDDSSRPSLEFVSRQLASYGVTGITDATPGNSVEEAEVFVRAIEEKRLLQRVLLMGDLELPQLEHRFAQRGAYKILLDERRLPQLDVLTEGILSAHSQRRPVAIHCVTRTELIFALSALITAGHVPGDRIEHASVTPDDALPLLREARVAVVTQFGFIAERGDQYLRDVAPKFHDLLYRGRAFLDAGLPLAGSSDAPYGSADPWLVMRAAVGRSTASGQSIGVREKLTPEQALALFTSSPALPGAATRVVALGEVADFCLLDRCWKSARTRLQAADVMTTVKAGEPIYCR
jgi:predicted amidohydrolase YtcJ